MFCTSSGIRVGCLMMVWFASSSLFSACYSLPQTNQEVNASPELNIIEKNRLMARRVTIASLLEQSTTTNQGSEKILHGQITQVAPFLQGQSYQLTDETGEIWVVSRSVDLNLSHLTNNDLTNNNLNNSAEPKPVSVLVKGLIRYQSIPAGGKDWGEVYLEEQQFFTLD